MQLGLQIPNFTWPGGPEKIGETLAAIGKRAEDAGFASVWVMDHFFQIPFVGPVDIDMLEGYTALGFLAAATKRVKLGTMVTGVTYRNPGVLVKTVTTLDVLSGGRAWFGVGAAWFEREHQGLGVQFPPLKERFERLEETLQIALQMWSGKVGPYEGKHYKLAETLCVPQPIQKPHPPILIGGSGEKKTLSMVARYAQACNLFMFAGDEVLRQKLEVLKEHCKTQGRDYNTIHKTVLGSFNISKNGGKDTKTPQQVLETFHRAAEMGIDEVIFNMPNVSDPHVFDLLASEIIPQTQKLGAATR